MTEPDPVLSMQFLLETIQEAEDRCLIGKPIVKLPIDQLSVARIDGTDEIFIEYRHLIEFVASKLNDHSKEPLSDADE